MSDIDDLLLRDLVIWENECEDIAGMIADAKEESRHDVEEAIATKGGNEVEVE